MAYRAEYTQELPQVLQQCCGLRQREPDEFVGRAKRDFAAEPVHYFLSQWWENGQCERWAEMHIRNHPNFGISTTSRVERSHGAIKRGSNEALFVRLEITNQIETSKLCTAISRSGLELVYGEVMKKVQQQQEDGSWETCTCSAWHRYLLPCSHRIQLGV
ncbi:hypothetical protein V1523DRAFT_440266 [Lipomyces doorenjongii]